MKEYKKVIPGFGIREGKAAALWGADCCENDVLALSRYYGDSGADELFLYDMAETDEDHERTIGLIKAVNSFDPSKNIKLADGSGGLRM